MPYYSAGSRFDLLWGKKDQVVVPGQWQRPYLYDNDGMRTTSRSQARAPESNERNRVTEKRKLYLQYGNDHDDSHNNCNRCHETNNTRNSAQTRRELSRTFETGEDECKGLGVGENRVDDSLDEECRVQERRVNKALQGVCDSSLVPAVVEVCKGDGGRRGNREIIPGYYTVLAENSHNQVQPRLIGSHNGWIQD
jgi:hypothetical protein